MYISLLACFCSFLHIVSSFYTKNVKCKTCQLNTLPIREPFFSNSNRRYPLSRPYYKNYINRISNHDFRLGSGNKIENNTMSDDEYGEQLIKKVLNKTHNLENDDSQPKLRIIINKDILPLL